MEFPIEQWLEYTSQSLAVHVSLILKQTYSSCSEQWNKYLALINFHLKKKRSTIKSYLYVHNGKPPKEKNCYAIFIT